MLVDKLGDIKEMILEQVKDFVITKIITAGITWLIGLLNPAAAFIKACKLIYDVMMFFVNNASRILKFVNTIIDSVADIVRGNISGVVDKIDDVLGQMVPIIIGFLASVLGLGGIGQKIRQIVETLQKPVNKALDFVIKTGLKLAGPIIRGHQGDQRQGQGQGRRRQGLGEGQGRLRRKQKEKFTGRKGWLHPRAPGHRTNCGSPEAACEAEPDHATAAQACAVASKIRRLALVVEPVGESDMNTANCQQRVMCSAQPSPTKPTAPQLAAQKPNSTTDSMRRNHQPTLQTRSPPRS